MYALLALIATVLTSLLPILNKQLLRDARPALVAWAINAFSLPVLAVGTFLLTQCKLTPFTCIRIWATITLHGSVFLSKFIQCIAKLVMKFGKLDRHILQKLFC